MKLLIYLLVLVLFLSSVDATFRGDLKDCGENTRCIFRISAQYNDKEGCSNLRSDIVNDCESYVDRVSGLIIASSSFVSFNLVTTLFMIIILASLFFIIYYYKEIKPRNESSVDALKPYIEKSLERNENPNVIKKRLLKTGWGKEEIKQAFSETRKK